MSLPLPVHRRLDVLAELAGDVTATRAEIVGMLIARAEPNIEELERAVLAYRKLNVGQVVPPESGGPSSEGDGVVIPLRPPGRPSHHRDVG